MAKIFIQASPCPWGSSTSMLATASQTSGTIPSAGYARVTGVIISSASLVSGSGLQIWQSSDGGSHWDYEYRSDLSACSGSGYSLEILGNAIKIDIKNGADNAGIFRTAWRFRPV